jgi:hypothetical protein
MWMPSSLLSTTGRHQCGEMEQRGAACWPCSDEQTSFVNLIKGHSGMFRNPVAHDPRLNRTVIDEELLELLTTLSMVHRRLDNAQLQP